MTRESSKLSVAATQLAKGKYLELVAELAALSPKDFRSVVLAARLERQLRSPITTDRQRRRR